MYSIAVFPDRYRACGVELLPLTLGHAILLERLGNPMALPDASEADRAIGYEQVLICAMVCSRPWPAAARLVNSWRAAAWLRWHWFVRRRVAMADTVALLRWHRAMWEVPKSQLLHKYTGPRRGAELLNLLAVSATTFLYKAQAEVLDLQITRLQWDLLVSAEQSGAIVMGGAVGPSLVEIAKAAQAKERAAANGASAPSQQPQP